MDDQGSSCSSMMSVNANTDCEYQVEEVMSQPKLKQSPKRLGSIPEGAVASPSQECQELQDTEVAGASGGAPANEGTAFRDCIIKMLDEMDKRSYQLRNDAMKLETERDDLLSSLVTLSNSEMLWKLEGIELDEIQRYLERIQKRTAGLQVDVKTERSSIQVEALNKVNRLIDSMILDVKKDTELGRKRCLAYINACSDSESVVEEGTGIDSVFEAAVLECAADDQKRIKKRLTGLQAYFMSMAMEISEECSQDN